MRYYDDEIILRTFKRTYTTMTPFGKEKVAHCEQLIFIIKETKKFMYGSSYNRRWKFDKTTNAWFEYHNGGWREKGGLFEEVK